MLLLSAALLTGMQTAEPVHLVVTAPSCAIRVDGAPVTEAQLTGLAAQWRGAGREVLYRIEGEDCAIPFATVAMQARLSRLFPESASDTGAMPKARVYVGGRDGCTVEVNGRRISTADLERLAGMWAKQGRGYLYSADFDADRVCASTVQTLLMSYAIGGSGG